MKNQISGVLLALIVAATTAGAQTVDSRVFASGAFADPPNASTGVAQGTFQVDPTALTVTYSVTSSGLVGVPTMGHIHRGAPGVVGPVFLALTPTGGGSYAGVASISPAQLTDFYDGLWYLNVHTSLFMISGEVRGQIVPPRRLHTRWLTGANAVPPLVGTLGLLDSAGQAVSGFAFPPGALPAGLLGVTLLHSSVVVTGLPSLIGQSSHPVPLTLIL